MWHHVHSCFHSILIVTFHSIGEHINKEMSLKILMGVHPGLMKIIDGELHTFNSISNKMQEHSDSFHDNASVGSICKYCSESVINLLSSSLLK